MDIVIVHSDPQTAGQLQALLEARGHLVHTFASLGQVSSIAPSRRLDLLIAECRLLESDGAPLFHVLGRQPHPPMILPLALPSAAASAAALADAEGLEAALAQAQTLLVQRDAAMLRVGDLAIDLATKRVTLHGRHVALPPIQFRLLVYLAQHAGRVVGAQEILKAVWGYEGDENEARELVKVHVRQIRRRLGLEAKHADYVQSVRGFGYLVSAPGAEQ